MRTVSEQAFIKTLENYFDERIVANRYRDEEKDVFRLAKTAWNAEKSEGTTPLLVIEQFEKIIDEEARKTPYYAAVMTAFATAKNDSIYHLNQLLAQLRMDELNLTEKDICFSDYSQIPYCSDENKTLYEKEGKYFLVEKESGTNQETGEYYYKQEIVPMSEQEAKQYMTDKIRFWKLSPEITEVSDGDDHEAYDVKITEKGKQLFAKELALSNVPVKENVEQEFIDKMVYENGTLLVSNNYTFQSDGKECSGGVYLFELNGEFYEQSFQDGKPDFYQKLSLAEAIESIKSSIHHSSVQEEFSVSQEAYEIADVSFPEHDTPYSIKLANAWQEQVEKAEWELENLTEANAVATVIYEGITTARSSIYEVNGEYYLSEHTENFTNGMITEKDESSLVTEEKAVELINAWQEQVEENIHLGEIGEPPDMLVSIKITDKGEQLLSDGQPKKTNKQQDFGR